MLVKKINVNENKRMKLIKIKDLIDVNKKGSIKKEGAVMLKKINPELFTLISKRLV